MIDNWGKYNKLNKWLTTGENIVICVVDFIVSSVHTQKRTYIYIQQ